MAAEGTPPFLQFKPEQGRLSGSTGCNRLNGEYRSWGAAGFTALPLATTRMACQGERGEQEVRFLGALARATKGGISYPTGGASGNASVLTGVSATAFRPTITATSKVIFATRVSIPTITNVLVQVGLGQAPSATDPAAANSGTDSAEFFFDPANALSSGVATSALGNWLVRWRSASGTVTYRDTGVPVVAGQDYNLAIAFNDSIQPVFLINRDIRAVGVHLATGIVMIPQFGVKTSTAAARSFEARYAKVGRDCA